MLATMVLLTVAGLLAGVALGLLRFKVFVLLPALGFICIVAIGVAIIAPSEIIILATVLVAISLQIGYLLGSAIRYMADARGGMPPPPMAASDKECVPLEAPNGDSPHTARHSSLLPP
jgi:hypothetical protein